ncbi:unnamed protein product [Caenorhabditis auriculariae]|uniref:3'-5' exonuclease domain-containing protein n=1 Tax=Caenorhabditis auriculariae TaxID=2777116 RepID=A0A8S1H4D9_9PELO|nr:unnamed protein product [Caenorhabditis auriculariae]
MTTDISADDETSAEAEIEAVPVKVKLTKAEKKLVHGRNYPEIVKERREVLKLHHNESEEVRKLLNQYFDEDDANPDENLFYIVGQLFLSMPDRMQHIGDPSNLAALVIDTFAKWLGNKDGAALKAKYLNHEIRVDALKACGGRAAVFMDDVKELFDLNEAELVQDVDTEIKSHLAKKNFKEAMEMAQNFGVKQNYRFGDFLVQLLLQDKAQCVHEYIKDQPKLQKDLVLFYDDLVAKSDMEVEATLRPYKEDMKLPLERFCGKTMEKTINALFHKVAKQYNYQIDQSMAPRFTQQQYHKQLRHNVCCRYDPNSKTLQTDENFFQGCRKILTDNTQVQNFFLHFLWSSNEYRKQVDAVSWKIHLNIPDGVVPGAMRREMPNLPGIQRDAEELLRRRIKEQKVASDVMEVTFEGVEIKIFIVSKPKLFCQLIEELEIFANEPGERLIGFDSEWKPNYTDYQSKMGLMQMFFNGKVYILDVATLEADGSVGSDMWCRLPKKLDDWAGREKLNNMFCIKRFGENMNDVKTGALGMKTFKLSELAVKFCNVELDKREQCSDWSARPLRPSQVTYAAMDACVVVAIFKCLRDLAMEVGINEEEMDTIITDAMSNSPKKDKGKKAKKMDAMSWAEVHEAFRDVVNPKRQKIRPNQLNVLVDTMLLGLGKHLRRVGIDVIIPNDNRQFTEMVRQAKNHANEGVRRIILTVSGKSNTKLSSTVDSSMLFCLPNGSSMAPMEQLRAVLQHFNVELRAEDIFSRCMECNSSSFLRVPCPVVHLLHNYFGVHLNNNVYGDTTFPFDEWVRKLEALNPEKYDGIRVEIFREKFNDERFPDEEDYIVANVEEGDIHLTRNVVLHRNQDEPTDVRISKVPEDAFHVVDRIFFICGECGRVYWDGRHVENYVEPESPNTEETAVGSNSNISI